MMSAHNWYSKECVLLCFHGCWERGNNVLFTKPHPKGVIANPILATIMANPLDLSTLWSAHEPLVTTLQWISFYPLALPKTKNTRAKS